MNEGEIFSFLGQIGGYVLSGAAGAALLRLFASKWVENAFSKNLEAFKVEKLHEFDLLLTTKVKWNELEYEVLSASWVKITHALRALKATTALMREHADLDKMSDAEFSLFLKMSDLSDEAKHRLQTAEKKNYTYAQILDIRALNDAYDRFIEFHSFFEERRIFLRPEIKVRFVEIDNLLWSTWVDIKIGQTENERQFTLAARQKIQAIDPLLNEIELLIQGKLFPEGTTIK